MIVVEKKSLDLSYQKYRNHTLYKDGGTWYDEACNILGLKYYLHSLLRKA